jgi:Domain of unknown function (DUF4864)
VTRLAAVLLLCAALGACSPSAEPGGASPAGRSPAAATATPQEPAPSPAPGSEPGPEASDPHGALACDEEVVAGIDQTVAGQLEALSGADYAGALTFSSARFRASTTPDAFGALIERDYQVMTEGATHTSGTCVRAGDAVQVLISVTGTSGVREFIYTLVQEDDAWRIDTAAPAPAAGAEA